MKPINVLLLSSLNGVDDIFAFLLLSSQIAFQDIHQQLKEFYF